MAAIPWVSEIGNVSVGSNESNDKNANANGNGACRGDRDRRHLEVGGPDRLIDALAQYSRVLELRLPEVNSR